MVEVFHRIKFRPNLIFEKAFRILELDYKKIAEVGYDDLGSAWNLTQNINIDWIKHKEVKYLGEYNKVRSSDVGDIFKVGNTFHLIMPVGYQVVQWGNLVNFAPDFSAPK